MCETRDGTNCVINILTNLLCNELYLTVTLCRCLPIQDEICKRSLKFVRKCINSNVDVVRSLAMLSHIIIIIIIKSIYAIYIAQSR